jgi:Flp pilus assembly protein TadB
MKLKNHIIAISTYIFLCLAFSALAEYILVTFTGAVFPVIVVSLFTLLAITFAIMIFAHIPLYISENKYKKENNYKKFIDSFTFSL